MFQIMNWSLLGLGECLESENINIKLIENYQFKINLDPADENWFNKREQFQ